MSVSQHRHLHHRATAGRSVTKRTAWTQQDRPHLWLAIAAAIAMGATILTIVLVADVDVETKLIVAVLPLTAAIGLAFFSARLGLSENRFRAQADRIVERMRRRPDRADTSLAEMPATEITGGGEVVPFVSPETLGAARRLARKVISQERARGL